FRRESGTTLKDIGTQGSEKPYFIMHTSPCCAASPQALMQQGQTIMDQSLKLTLTHQDLTHQDPHSSSLIRTLTHQDPHSSFITTLTHQDPHSSRPSLIRTLTHQDPHSSGPSLISTFTHQYRQVDFLIAVVCVKLTNVTSTKPFWKRGHHAGKGMAVLKLECVAEKP
ncbi:hypothetical protein STEG23_030066, partial [Scotinomys teguina]